MKNISKLICLILAISAIRVDLKSRPKIWQQSNSVADNFGNTGTCQRISECQRFGPIICCPPTRSRPPQGEGTMGEQIGVNGQNEQNENVQNQSVSQRKCLENYPPLPIVKKEDTLFNITGGEPFPYMAAIGFENKDGGYDFSCGGFLVDKKFVVTVAHCETAEGVRPSIVRLGGKSLDTPGADFNIKIARIIKHPKFKRSQIYNDIAVFQLESEVPNRPVCLWPSDKINFQEGTVLGYGRTGLDGEASSKLKKVKLSIFSNEECSRYYERDVDIGQTQLCAGDRKGVKDTCQGDSGGPLLVTSLEQLQIIPYVIGITSFGRACGLGALTIFTRISSFIPWIESVVWPNEF